MMLIDVNKVKPDPNQPRRTFNEEKMEALEASMKADGFRPAYPIIIDEDLVIVDGERRWRIAKKLGIKKVSAEVKTGVKDWERLLYQLQSEGAELDAFEKYTAWAKEWDMVKGFETKRSLAGKLGITENALDNALIRYENYQGVIKNLRAETRTQNLPDKFYPLAEIGREKDPELREELAEKAIKEGWEEHKVRDIRKALEEFPHRKKEILSRDYSDPVNQETGETLKGSNAWRDRLKVATMDIDFNELHANQKNWEHQEVTFDAYDVILTSASRLRTALEKFDYKIVAPHIRASIHKELSRLFPTGMDWLKSLEKYMVENGELTNGSKQLK